MPIQSAEEFNYLVGKYAVENRRVTKDEFGFINGKVVMLHVSMKYVGYKSMDREQALELQDEV